MNIVDPILRQCRLSGEQPALCAPGTKLDLVTYAQLEYMINNATRALLELGFKPGQIVGVWVDDKIFHIVLLLALTRMGLATVSFRGAYLPKELAAAAIIMDKPQNVSDVDQVIRAHPEWVLGNGQPVEQARLPHTDGKELCRVILTSGSTGVPKAIAFSHDKLIAKNARLEYCQGDRWPHSSRLFCDLGLSSSQGFRYVIDMLARGGFVLLYGEDGMSTLQSLSLFKIQGMATSPHGLSEYLKFFESQPAFDCSLDHVLVAGGMLTKALAERAWMRMSPHLISLYGATEVGAIATADARAITQIPGAVGYLLPDAEAQVVDSSGNPVPWGKEGIVRVKTAQVADGYYGDPATSASVFRDGWFYPGDFGYLTEDRLLVVTGRQETRMNIGGEKIHPEILEEALRGYPGVSDAAVVPIANAFGVDEVYAVLKSDTPPGKEALRAFLETRVSRSFLPVDVVMVDAIPRSPMGKIERGRLLEVAKSKLMYTGR